MLNERGIKAVTPSALNTPAGANFSPTVTPCNSPEGSPTRSMSPEPPLLSGLLASGADILRKKFAVASSSPGIGDAIERPSRLTARNKLALTRLEKKALRSIKIMEKVESMGVDNFMHGGGHGISPLALHGSSALYTSTVRGRTSSPMAQLTSLKHLQDSRKQQQGQDELLIDKETIKKVLSKGLSHEGLKHISSGSSEASGASSSAGSSTTSGVYPDSDSGSSSASGAVAVLKGKGKPEKQESSAAAATSAARLKQMQRQKSRRSLLNGANGSQRPDLGTVNGSSRPGVRPDLGTVGGAASNKTKSNSKTDSAAAAAPAQVPEQSRSIGQSVYGTISSLLFGRKGGLL